VGRGGERSRWQTGGGRAAAAAAKDVKDVSRYLTKTESRAHEDKADI
jgi:hypothetical protein